MDRTGLKASDIARVVWGSTKDKRGYSVARNRDRIGHYLAGTSYPGPENLQKLADVLGIPVETLAIERPSSAAEVAAEIAARGRREPFRPVPTGLSGEEGSVRVIMPPVRAGLAQLFVSGRRMSTALALQIAQMIAEDDAARERPISPEVGKIVGGTKGTA